MDTEANVDDLIDRWEVMWGRGMPPTVEERCAGRPELAEELRRRIEAIRAILALRLSVQFCPYRGMIALAPLSTIHPLPHI